MKSKTPNHPLQPTGALSSHIVNVPRGMAPAAERGVRRLGESGFVVQSRRNQMTAKEKAKAGLWLLKQAVLELVEARPDGIAPNRGPRRVGTLLP